MPQTISIGTCAWSFDDWSGVFYPDNLPDQQRLAFYARYLNAVEIDSTFYGPPHPKTGEHWAAATPDDFVFACKMPREITHVAKLRDCQALLEEFLRSIEALAPKLGCVLIQLPPYLHADRNEAAFRDFIRHLPSTVRFAVEFRDESWHVPRIAHLLAEHRVCWVWNDLTELDHRDEGAFNFLPATTDFLYLRLMGDLEAKYGAQGEPIVYNRLQWPRQASIESWAIKARQHFPQAARTLIFVNNHFEGFAPQSCQRVATALGLEIRLPEPAAQPSGDAWQLNLKL